MPAHRLAAFALAAGALALAACNADTAALRPLDWQKVTGPAQNGAVLGLGASGDFDEVGSFTVHAFREGAEVMLYYGGSDADAVSGCAGINSTHWRIGLATSSDGVTFTRVRGDKTGGSIVENGDGDPATADFDSQLTYHPFVLHDGALWRMWFNGSTHAFNCPTGTLALDRRIGYAESSDGVHWTKRYDGDGPGGSVLPLGPAGSIDAQQVGYAWILKDGAEYKMYYSANDATNTWRVALATSTDGRHWTKHPGKQTGGAILDIGPAGAFDTACAYQPSVVKERSQLYRMWYRGCAAPGAFGGPSRGTIGYAESNDGITFVKVPQPTPAGDALERGPAGSLDSGGLTTPSVFLDANGWNMYYAGFDTNGLFLVGLARATP
ncbi:MAG TPA: hypothetical protein VFP50_09140 [Anaeromyxobacteraceae bacterium]|nr:hypothetical protein [Anaeromyxobacteraceae bacterium]